MIVASGWTAIAQGNGGDVLFSHIDLPSADQVINKDAFAIHGWAFNCAKGGQQPPQVTVRLFTGSGFTVVPVTVHRTLYRPDVKAAYSQLCFDMSSFTGYALVPSNPASLPTGTFQLVVEWLDGYGVTYTQMAVTLQ